MSLAISSVGSLLTLVYVCLSFRCRKQSCIYSALSSITMEFPLSVFLMERSVFLVNLCRAICSYLVKLCLGAVYFSVCKDVSVSCMYFASVSLACCGKCVARSVSLFANV